MLLSGLQLPPTVQNCPNRSSDATRNPLSNVVIWTSGKCVDGLAYSTSGSPGNGCDNGGGGDENMRPELVA